MNAQVIGTNRHARRAQASVARKKIKKLKKLAAKQGKNTAELTETSNIQEKDNDSNTI